MTAVPMSLPGMLPLPGAQTLPGTMPTPHDPSADPFLALLAQLVTPAQAAGTPTPGEVPVEVPGEVAAVVVSPIADAEADAEAGDAPPATDALVPVMPPLPVVIQPAVVPHPGSEQPALAAIAQGAQDAKPVAAATSGPAPEASALPTSSPVVAATPVTPLTNHVAGGGAAAPEAVTRQVFPEVVRAAATGVTPNRVVVRLEPEHLGEVRIVLRTDRSGTLEVSLAGGPEARAAIREGAPELRRLLEATGSHDPRVLVRHLTEASAAPVAPTTPTTTARTDVPTTAGGPPVDVGAGTAGGTAPGTSQGEERRGRDPQDARPGATDGTPDRTVDSAGPATRRAGGLDVMM